MNETAAVKGRVSAVIPTYHRPQMLLDTVRDLSRQHYADFEIIVVDQTPGAGLADSLRAFPRVRYFHLESSGLTPALNVGWRNASGEIVLLLDDDIRVDDPDFFSKHVRHHEDSSVGAVGGAIYKPDQKDPGVLSPKFFRSKLQWCYFRFDLAVRMEAPSFPGANVSLRRATLEALGGIDENFIKNAYHWELDTAYRIRRLGLKILFDPEARIIHYYGSPGGAANALRTQQETAAEEYFFFLFRNSIYCFLKHEKRHLPFLLVRLLREYAINRCYLKKGLTFVAARLGAFFAGGMSALRCYWSLKRI